MGEFVLRITSRAQRDLREIVEYIARDNPGAAERVGLRLIEQVELLTKFPKLGREVRQRRGNRVLPERNILIFYHLHPNARIVEIKRFWHSARGIPDL
jgi:plasmid stabilization system protein ParE